MKITVQGVQLDVSDDCELTIVNGVVTIKSRNPLNYYPYVPYIQPSIPVPQDTGGTGPFRFPDSTIVCNQPELNLGPKTISIPTVWVSPTENVNAKYTGPQSSQGMLNVNEVGMLSIH